MLLTTRRVKRVKRAEQHQAALVSLSAAAALAPLMSSQLVEAELLPNSLGLPLLLLMLPLKPQE